MHGETPVSRPPRKPISATVNTTGIRGRCGPGLVPIEKNSPTVAGLFSSRSLYWPGGISTVSIMYTVALAV